MEELVSGLLRPKLFPFGKLSKAKSAAQRERQMEGRGNGKEGELRGDGRERKEGEEGRRKEG